MKKHQLLTLLALSIVYIVWGSTFFGVKLALEGGLSPFLMIGLRFSLAGAVLYGMARWRGAAPAQASDWKEATWLGFLLLVCGPGLVAWSEQYISSSLAALLVATSPVWVTMLDREQKLTARKWFGLLLGLLGVGWLVGASISFESEGLIWGSLACLASALAWAIGSLRARGSGSRLSPISRAGMQMICAGVMLLLAGLATEDRLAVETVSQQAWLSLLYLTVFGSLVAFSAYSWLVSNVSASVVSTHAYVNPVVAVVLGAMLGGESLSQQTGLAAIVAMVGVVVLMLPQPAAKKPALALVAEPPPSPLRQARASRGSSRRIRRRAS